MKMLDPDFPVFELCLENSDDSAYDLLREMIPDTDRDGRKYVMVTQCLENDDFYQGLNMITVIRRISDGKLFGYSWWDDISKHGQSYMESNGDEFGLENDVSADDYDWDTFISYFVFEPVEKSYITSYVKVKK